MEKKPANYLLMEDGSKIDFIPPTPTETQRGGIIAKERTTENNEVVIDSATGKAYVNAQTEIELSDNLYYNASGQLDVHTADDVEQDNTRPITSAAVYVELGNIDALLKSI